MTAYYIRILAETIFSTATGDRAKLVIMETLNMLFICGVNKKTAGCILRIVTM
jgi:hypothetical protein